MLNCKGIIKGCFNHNGNLNSGTHRPGTFKIPKCIGYLLLHNKLPKMSFCASMTSLYSGLCSWAVVILRLDCGTIFFKVMWLPGGFNSWGLLESRPPSHWSEATLNSWPHGQYLLHDSLFHQTEHVCKARRQEQASPGKMEVTILCNLVTEVSIAVFYSRT